MRRKGIMLMLTIIACISIIGVGFAAWIIIGGDSKDVTGNITVEEVENASVSIESYKFLDVTGDNVADDTISFLGSDGVECEWIVQEGVSNLKVKLEVVIKTANTAYFDKLTAELSIIDSNETDANSSYNSLVQFAEGDSQVELLKALPTPTVTQPTFEGTDGEYTGTAYVEIEFEWGSAFDNKNPLAYYSDKSVNEYSSQASTRLTAINNALKNLGFNIKLNAIAKAN